ncbi:TPA: hypothetical protein ACH3X3_013616 [Trebouxia sp. C0006]
MCFAAHMGAMALVVLIVSTPTPLPMVVPRVGQIFIAALGRLRLGLALDIHLNMLGWYGAKAQSPTAIAGLLCFTKHEDQMSRAKGSLACQFGGGQHMCDENLYCNLISLHSACIPAGVVDFELDTAYVHYAHA